MHDIIPHRTVDVYQEVAPDGCSVAMLFILLLSSKIDGIGILHVHLVSAVRKPLESTKKLTRLFV